MNKNINDKEKAQIYANGHDKAKDGQGKGDRVEEEKVEETDLTRDQEAIFGRSSSTMRTPPASPATRREKARSLPEIPQDLEVAKLFLPWEGQGEVCSKKRPPSEDKSEEAMEEHTRKKKKGEGEEEKLAREMQVLIRQIPQVAKKLNQLGKAYPNTQLDIKKHIGEACRCAEALDRRANKWQEVKEIRVQEARRKIEQGIDTTESHNPMKQDEVGYQRVPCETKEMGTQVTEAEIEDDVQTERRGRLRAVNNVLDKGEGRCYEDIAKILDIVWPEEAYQKVKEEKESLTKIRTDAVAIVDISEKVEGEHMSPLMRRHPELADMLEDGLEKGEIVYMVNHTKMKGKGERGRLEENERYVFLLPLKIDPEGINDMETVYQILIKMKAKMQEEGRTKFTCVSPRTFNGDYIRRMLEYVFRDSAIQAAIYLGGTIKRKEAKGTGGTVVVNAGKRTYSELLKTVKQNVDVDSLGLNIRAVRKTQRGNLLLRLDGDNDMAGKLKREIVENIRGVEARVATNNATVYVTGLEEDITQEEVQAGLSKSLGVPRGRFEIAPLRRNRYGGQTAIVTVSRELERELTSRGKIRLGWTQCNVRGKVTVDRCFRCLECGHRATACKGPDRSGNCWNCGEAGHTVKECQGAAGCVVCEEGHHRTDSMGCPVYRKLVQAVRSNRPKNN